MDATLPAVRIPVDILSAFGDDPDWLVHVVRIQETDDRHRFAVRVPPPSGVGRTSKNNPTPELFSWKRSLNHDGVWLHITEGGMDGSVQQACMDSLFGGAKSEPTGEWTEIDLNGISRWQKQDDGAADIIWKSAD